MRIFTFSVAIKFMNKFQLCSCLKVVLFYPGYLKPVVACSCSSFHLWKTLAKFPEEGRWRKTFGNSSPHNIKDTLIIQKYLLKFDHLPLIFNEA